MASRGGVHNFHKVRAVDYGPDLFPVDLNVVTDIAKLLNNSGVSLAIDIADVGARHGIVIVQGAFVAAHISLVEQEETLGFEVGAIGLINSLLLMDDDLLVVRSAARK